MRSTAVAETAGLLADLVGTASRARVHPVPARRRGRGGDRAATGWTETGDGRPGAPGRRLPVRATCRRSAGNSRTACAAARSRRWRRRTALELGVNITGLDAVLIAGWPGTRAALWQQAGRAGRAGPRGGRHPDRPRRPARHLSGASPGGAAAPAGRGDRSRPGQPVHPAPHLCAAAAELPLTATDLDLFGPAAPARDRRPGRGGSAQRPRRPVAPDRRRIPLTGLRGTGGRAGRGSWRSRPAGWSAPWTSRRRTCWRTPARSIRTRASCTW